MKTLSLLVISHYKIDIIQFLLIKYEPFFSKASIKQEVWLREQFQ